MRVDALQKYRNQLLSAFNAEQLQYLKYDSWSGLLTETDRLYATMFHDWDVLQKDCSDLAEAVQTLEWTVAPYVADGEKPNAKAQEVAKTVTDALWKRTPHAPGTYSHSFPQLINALVHALFRGYNVHEIEWVNADGLVYPAAFHQLPPQFMRWEDRAGQVDRLLFIPDGETETPRPFPKNKYLVALNTSGPDHPLFNAMYYSLIAWYGAYKFGLGWFMEYCQKYGMPKLVFHYESESDRRQLEKDLAEERVLNNILLKGDRAVDIANAPASGASLPQRELLTLAESQCHKLILGQTLTSDTSQHGGSLAQAKVHAGVQAEVVKKRADFVADVLNSQLIPAIVLLNYGTLDVPMPELRYKIPQEGVTLERVQVVKTALEIKGMKLKKNEVYEFTGFAQPADGDEVFEAASAEGDMAGLAGLLGKGKPQDDTDPDNDPNKPKKKAPAKESEDVEPVSAAKTDAPTDPAQEWLAPIKQKFLEARKAGASMADMRKMLLTMHPNTKALAKAFANNILAGFAGESEEVDAANPWGCNQYGHRKGHKGGESKKKESDDVYDFDNMEPDERLQRAIDDLGDAEEEDIDWDDYDKAQEVKKIFNPDNHKVPQWRKDRMIQEVGNRVTDALRHLANVNKARRDFRNPNRPTEDDVNRAEEAFGKAVHEWRRFHRARLEVQGWDKKAIDGYLSRWPEYMETANAEDIDAANPYGCNQYGEGWVRPHNGMQTMRRRKDATPAPDTSKLDELKVDDDDDSPEAMEKRKQRFDLHKQFAEEMEKRLQEWLKSRGESVKAAAGTEDDKRPFPVQMPDGSMCHTYGCERHKGADELAIKQADKKLDELMRQAKEAFEKGQMTKLQKIMEEHAAWRSYVEKIIDLLRPKEIKRYFETAKTREEAIRNTKSLIDGKGRVKWSKDISIEQINEFNETIAAMKEKYPLETDIVKLGSYISEDDDEGAHCAAWSKPNTDDIVLHLELNQDHEYGGVHDFHNWKPYENWEVKQSGGYKRMNVGASKSGISIRAVMLHEYGHALHSRAHIAVDHSDKINASWIKDNVDVGNKWKEVYATAVNNGDIVKISEYAAGNDSEFFAECFAARELGEKLPDYINTALDNVINLAIKKP